VPSLSSATRLLRSLVDIAADWTCGGKGERQRAC
jgi:hypothetical protein